MTMPRVTNTIRSQLLLVPLIFSVGCAKYQVIALQPLRPEFHRSALSVEGVHACYEVLDGVSSKRYFNKDLTKVGIQPVQLTIANNSKRTLILDLTRCSLPCMPGDQVAKKAHFNTAGRATAYGVAGIFIWPLLIPAIVDGTGSSKANTQMDYDFASKGLKDQVIHPFDTSNGVFFVPVEKMSPNLTIRLVDREAGEILQFSWSDGLPVAARCETIDELRLATDVSQPGQGGERPPPED
jgi:hypothetical protein